MLQKVQSVVRRWPFSLVTAAFLAVGYLVAGLHSPAAGPEAMARHLGCSAAMFLLLFTALRLFFGGVRRDLAKERAVLDSERVNGLLLWGFVFYKESIKTVVGVSFSLGWLAGLLFITERFGGQFILLPVGLGVALSVLAFFPAYLFGAVLDQIRYPQRG